MSSGSIFVDHLWGDPPLIAINSKWSWIPILESRTHQWRHISWVHGSRVNIGRFVYRTVTQLEESHTRRTIHTVRINYYSLATRGIPPAHLLAQNVVLHFTDRNINSPSRSAIQDDIRQQPLHHGQTPLGTAGRESGVGTTGCGRGARAAERDSFLCAAATSYCGGSEECCAGSFSALPPLWLVRETTHEEGRERRRSGGGRRRRRTMQKSDAKIFTEMR